MVYNLNEACVGPLWSYHCLSSRRIYIFFNADPFQVNFCLNYSLRDSGLTDTGAIALAEALLRNKSLEVLK